MTAVQPMASPDQCGLPVLSLTHLDNFDALNYEPEPSVRILKFTNGDVYQGETFADLRHGKGKHVCSNGDTHEGGWYKGMRHGFGRAEFARGFSYEGEFQYDHAHGSGKAKYDSGAVYDGEFANDKRCGWGQQCFPDESVYEGEWEEDTMQGNGRLTLKDGAYYEGIWLGGQCTSGVWRSPDRQQEYRGGWVHGKKQGKGILLVSGMFHYEGQWEDDVQEGQGKCRWVDGSVYDGNWHAGQRHGTGRVQRADSYKYDGQWANDKEHGQGNARLSNGDRYHGQFRDGHPHGQGRSRSLDGDRYEGEWKQGKKNGKGRCAYAGGSRYQGDWVNDKRHGQGICHFADGNVFRGEWQEDHWVQSEAEPSLCRVAGPGLSMCTAGRPATFTILARDSLGNKRLSGGDTFLVWLEGPETVHGHIRDHENGTFTANYKAIKAGLYDLYITNETGESVAEAPFPLRVFAGKANPRNSIARQVWGHPGHVHQPCTFVVELRDSYDNRCGVANAADELPIEVEAVCGNASCKVEVAATTRGLHQCSFIPSSTGFYRISVTSFGQHVRNSPLSMQVTDPTSADTTAVGDQPVPDLLKQWEEKAAQQYQEDGNADGWDSDSQPETAEQKYMRDHPDVPVVENLEDMWKVTKLQRERKKVQEKAKALAEFAELQSGEPPGQQQSSHHHLPTQGHPQRAPMIGRCIEKAPTQSRKSLSKPSGQEVSPGSAASSDVITGAANTGGVDSLDPEQSVFTSSALQRPSKPAAPNRRRASLRVDESGMITQLSEISDVSSLSSKLTQASIGKGQGSSGEVDFDAPSPR